MSKIWYITYSQYASRYYNYNVTLYDLTITLTMYKLHVILYVGN